jgi:hypothetical protein
VSSTYQPANVSPEFTEEQRRWLEQEFSAIKRAWEADKPSEELTVRHASPTKVMAGMLVYADGTDWNPGSGEGVYRRNAANAAWVFLG